MATTKNVQEDEPRLTALEKQVQILTEAIECLTKQNQVLEEQLHRKTGHDIPEEDLEDTSAEQWHWEGSEGSNAPCRLEWQNVSLPSLMDATPPPCCREDIGDKGTDGGNDERFQGTSVQRSWLSC